MSKQVFIVDDDPMIRFLVSEFLKAHGYDITAFETGSSCLDHLKNNRCDLLIVDMQMPEMTGDEVLKAVSENPDLSRIPTMILTANVHGTVNTPGTKADAYVEKPFDMPKFLEQIAELIEKA